MFPFTTYMYVFSIRKLVFKFEDGYIKEEESHWFRKLLVTSGLLSLPRSLMERNEASVPRFHPAGRLPFLKERVLNAEHFEGKEMTQALRTLDQRSKAKGQQGTVLSASVLQQLHGRDRLCASGSPTSLPAGAPNTLLMS